MGVCISDACHVEPVASTLAEGCMSALGLERRRGLDRPLGR